MTPWQASVVVAGCVYVMVRSPVDISDRLGSSYGSPAASPHRRLPSRAWLVASVLVIGCVSVSAIEPRLLVLAAAALLAALASRRLLAVARSRRSRRERQRRVVTVCDALSAELRGGLPMSTAIRRACGQDGELAPVISAADLGGDIADALRGCAQRPGAEGLRAVAAALDVAGSSGSALSHVLDRVAKALREDDDARAEVAAALGPPRATARMLALLPLFGLGLGVSIGADPVRFLLGTSWGLGCLCGGVGLALTGLWWVERLALAAEE